MTQLLRILICIFTLGAFLYLYVDKLNTHTELRVQIPALTKEVDLIKQETIHLAYEVECFKNPSHLIQLAKQPEFTHLKFPYTEDILVISPGLASQLDQVKPSEELSGGNRGLKWPILLGTK